MIALLVSPVAMVAAAQPSPAQSPTPVQVAVVRPAPRPDRALVTPVALKPR